MRKPGYSAALSCVLVRAESAARELGSGVTGTEHLLLALAQEKISSAGKILICQGAEGRLLRCMLLTQPRPARRSGRPGLSGAASRALDAARRELYEETGYGGGEWKEYMVLSANPATHTNLTYTFLATGVQPLSTQHLEASEDIRIHLFTFEEVRRLLEENCIPQALMAAPLWRYVAEHSERR